jgi:hypothetical protein
MTTDIPDTLPDDAIARLPDALTAWQRLQRRVAAVMAVPPAASLSSGKPGVSSDVRERIRFLQRYSMKPHRPLTRVAVVDGYERAEPVGRVWCALAGLSPDEGAGARLVQSEVGELIARGYVAYGVAVALATMNEAFRRASSFETGGVFRLVTGDARTQHTGFFGRQSGRWASSIADPSARALESFRLASALHGDGLDFTSGARRWDDGYTQDRLWKSGRVRHDAGGIVRKWSAEGWEWVGPIFDSDGATPLIDHYRLMLFRFVGRKADTWRGDQAVLDGRARWGVK